MSEVLNHFVSNLPSIILILLANILFFGIKEIYVDRKTLANFEQKIKEDLKHHEIKMQSQIDKLKDEQHKQHTDFVELNTNVKHILKAIDEVKSLVKRKK